MSYDFNVIAGIFLFLTYDLHLVDQTMSDSSFYMM
jgi:hypothetical protein